jgi:hypothetical protein
MDLQRSINRFSTVTASEYGGVEPLKHRATHFHEMGVPVRHRDHRRYLTLDPLRDTASGAGLF